MQVIPENVIDQLVIWENETLYRLSSQSVVLLDLSDMIVGSRFEKVFGDILQFANDNG